jgi:hypothetical protein
MCVESRRGPARLLARDREIRTPPPVTLSRLRFDDDDDDDDDDATLAAPLEVKQVSWGRDCASVGTPRRNRMTKIKLRAPTNHSVGHQAFRVDPGRIDHRQSLLRSERYDLQAIRMRDRIVSDNQRIDTLNVCRLERARHVFGFFARQKGRARHSATAPRPTMRARPSKRSTTAPKRLGTPAGHVLPFRRVVHEVLEFVASHVATLHQRAASAWTSRSCLANISLARAHPSAIHSSLSGISRISLSRVRLACRCDHGCWPNLAMNGRRSLRPHGPRCEMLPGRSTEGARSP